MPSDWDLDRLDSPSAPEAKQTDGAEKRDISGR